MINTKLKLTGMRDTYASRDAIAAKMKTDFKLAA
jgi:hypothetical protein